MEKKVKIWLIVGVVVLVLIIIGVVVFSGSGNNSYGFFSNTDFSKPYSLNVDANAFDNIKLNPFEK